MTETITRAALYQLVWSEPLRTLSKRFGLSDVALAKRCRGANIPLPGIGYWAKREAGKAVLQPQLPPRRLGQWDSIQMRRSGWGTGWGGIPVQNDEELLRSNLTAPRPFPDGFPEVLEQARRLVGRVRVLSSLAKPHPVVARLLTEDDKRRAKQASTPYASSFYAPIFESPFERRRLRFMNSLLLAVTRAGGHASIRGNEGRELGVTIGDQHLSFTLGPLKVPPQSYPPKQLPANEKMKLEFSWYLPPPEVKLVWADGDGGTLEQQIEEIAASLFAYAEWGYRDGLRKRYELRLERKHELEEAIRKRREEEARNERERIEKEAAERRAKLGADAAARRQAADIRAYVEAQVRKWGPGADAETLTQLQAWAQWAVGQADDIDPLLGDCPRL